MSGEVPWIRDVGGVSPWDVLRLGGEYVPGKVSVVIDVARDIVEEKPKGEDGPTQTDNGYLGAGVTIDIEVWTEEQLDRLVRLLVNWFPKKPGATSVPVEIIYPSAIMAGISRIRIAGFSIPKWNKATLTIPLKAREWLPPGSQKPTSTSNQTQGGAGGGPDGNGGPLGGPGDVPPPDPENLGADFP